MKPGSVLLWILWLMLVVNQTPATSANDVHDARLVHGARRCSGLLEIQHQGQWRPPRFLFSSQPEGFAKVACLQMNCGALVSFQLRTNASEPWAASEVRVASEVRAAWEVNFFCHWDIQSIRQCRESKKKQTVRSVNSTADNVYVECSESLRLVSRFSANSCVGSVQLKSSLEGVDQTQSGLGWSQVCGEESAGDQVLMLRLMCSDLGCGDPTATQRPAPPSDRPAEARVVHCHGNETRIQQCPSRVQTNCSRVLLLSCNERRGVRLAEGGCRGVVEAEGAREWRPLTRQWQRPSESQLTDLCRLLGCGSLVSSSDLLLDLGLDPDRDLPLWEMDYECESRETFCRSWTGSSGRRVLSVVCTESVRMVGGQRCLGSVEVKLGGEWRGVCSGEGVSRGVTALQDFVGCRDLGCGFPREPRGGHRVSLELPRALRLNCSGDEERLVQCPQSTSPAGGDKWCPAALLSCHRSPAPPAVTLFSRLGEVSSSEVTVHWGHRVFVGCSVDSPFRVRSFRLRSHGDEGELEVWQNQTALDNRASFVLDSTNLRLEHAFFCSYNYDLPPHEFSEDRRVHIRFKDSSNVRLVGGASRCLGLLEVQGGQGEWRPLSQRHWGLREAAVVCRQLICGTTIATERRSAELQPTWSFFSDCEADDSALLDCGGVREGLSSSRVYVLCSDVLEWPRLSVLADGLYHTEQAVVSEGHSVLLRCSVNPVFPGGRFSLGVSRGDVPEHEASQANHSAVFTLHRVRPEHSGNYSCFYHNTIAQHQFTFQSSNVSLTVTEFGGDLRLVDGGDSCSGTLLMRDRTSQMKMVSAESWNIRLASMVCRRLSCGEALSTSTRRLQSFSSTWRFFSDCDGSEEALLDCGHIEEWIASSVILIHCSGNSHIKG